MEGRGGEGRGGETKGRIQIHMLYTHVTMFGVHQLESRTDKESGHCLLDLLPTTLHEEGGTLLQEGKPHLQVLHRKHLDSDERHSLNDTDDCRTIVLGVSNLIKEPPPDRVEA